MFDTINGMLTENSLWVKRIVNMYQKGINKVMLL
jgi:hypothetical protein